ncbi:MAG TPA: SMP-30/gluconolactonase/LRE family protein [Usitatibacter sp.]|nr:SMP-30/gluconolactonase/LRE family protein [Usitatibacter sp.]
MRALLLALALFAAALAAHPQDDPSARALAVIQAKLKERPNDATLYFFLARVRASQGDAKGATEALSKASELGDGFLPAKDEGFEKVWGDAAFQALRARMEKKLPRLDYAPVAIELEDNGLIPEGMAYDAPSDSFFVGSIAEHKIVRISPGNDVKDFATGLDSVLGIAVDAPRRVLYAVSTNALTAEGRKNRRNAIVEFETDAHHMKRRVEVPDAVQLNDVAVAPGGRVFTTDSGSGAVYEIRADDSVRTLVPPRALPGANGLAASPDAKTLYVAHNTGIAAVDIDKGTIRQLANDTRENVAAIDGLYQWHGQLIGVQNVTTPGRVVLITLSPAGDRIVKVQTMLSHHHNRLDEPTAGAPTDHGFFLLAATGVAHYDDAGRIERADDVPKPTILRLLLNP